MVLSSHHRCFTGGRFGQPWRAAPRRADGSAVGGNCSWVAPQRVIQVDRFAIVSLLARNHDFHLAVPAGMGANCSRHFLADGDCDDTHRWCRINRRLNHLFPSQNHNECRNGGRVVFDFRRFAVTGIQTEPIASCCASMTVGATSSYQQPSGCGRLGPPSDTALRVVLNLLHQRKSSLC